MKDKLSKEEKVLIRSFVNFERTRIELDYDDVRWLENAIRSITGNNNGDHRQMVEDYLNTII